MTLLKLQNSKNYADILIRYRTKKHVFPLIISVLQGIQKGLVYSDKNKTNYFIIHKFGFADLIESEENTEFDESLYLFLLEKKFINEKIRWYDVPEKWVNRLKNKTNKNIHLAERVQLINNTVEFIDNLNQDEIVSIEKITNHNFDIIDKKLGLLLSKRFWSSKKQFLKSSFGVAAYKNGIPVAICYACALDDIRAEIDVFTNETNRSQGLGKQVVGNFINMCIERGIRPHWDCYTNNQPSVLLAKSFCFNPYHVYAHAIISK